MSVKQEHMGAVMSHIKPTQQARQSGPLTSIQHAPPAPPQQKEQQRQHRQNHEGQMQAQQTRIALSPDQAENQKRARIEEDPDNMFSPTSAAALALSTLQHFGADRSRRPPTLTGTRLFNSSNTGSSNNNVCESKAPTTPAQYNMAQHPPSHQHHHRTPHRPPHPHSIPPQYSSHHPAVSWQHQQPPQNPSSSYYPPPNGTPHMYTQEGVGSYHNTGACNYSSERSWHESSGNSTNHSVTPVPKNNSWTGDHYVSNSYVNANHAPPPGTMHETMTYNHIDRHHSVNHGVGASTPSNVVIGPSPPSNRGSYYHHPPPNMGEKPLARLASCATTLVTPTPKKTKHAQIVSSASSSATATPSSTGAPAPSVTQPQQSSYSRKKKSLGVLAENFIRTYQGLPSGSTIVVDEAAVQLGVERRRIYDVVNILEAICLVSKKHKNTYSWLGIDHLDTVFGRLQAQAICDYPQDARHFGLLPAEPDEQKSTKEATSDENQKENVNCNIEKGNRNVQQNRRSSTSTKTRENKSLARLSQEFLQVFLVGHKTLSLPEASDKIQGITSMEELIAMGMNNSTSASNTSGNVNASSSTIAKSTKQGTSANTATKNGARDPKELRAAAARGLKTKIRRLYDIANVFLSVGLLKKVDSGDTSRRPNFSWTYRLSSKEIHELHQKKQLSQNPPHGAQPEKQKVQTPMVVPSLPEKQKKVQGPMVVPSVETITSATSIEI